MLCQMITKQKLKMEKVAAKYSDKNKMSRKMIRLAALMEMVFQGQELHEWEMEFDNPHSFKEIYQRYLSFRCQDLIDNYYFQNHCVHPNSKEGSLVTRTRICSYR